MKSRATRGIAPRAPFLLNEFRDSPALQSNDLNYNSFNDFVSCSVLPSNSNLNCFIRSNGKLVFEYNGDLNLNLEAVVEPSWIAVTVKILISTGICNGDHVVVHSEETGVSRMARAVALDPPQSSNISNVFRVWLNINEAQLKAEQCCLISPILAHNLGLQVHLQEFLHLLPDSESQEGEEDFRNESRRVHASRIRIIPLTNKRDIKVASHLRISLVKVPAASPLVSPSQSYKQLREAAIRESVVRYFSIERIISAGDIFVIPVTRPDPLTLLKYPKATSMDTVVCKISMAEPESEPFLLTSPDQTAMIWGESEPSHVPPNVNNWFNSIPNQQFPQPFNSSHLASLLVPSLHSRTSKLGISTAVLLVGSPGSGKRSTVRSACQALGIHCVEYSCHDLIGDSDKSTASAIEEAFSAAASYAPAVILLRNLEALASQYGSKSDAKAAGFTLRSCVKKYLECSKPAPPPRSKTQFQFQGHEFLVQPQAPLSTPVILVATAEDSDSLPVSLKRCFTHDIPVDPPDEDQRLRLIRAYLSPDKNVPEELAGTIAAIAAQTSGLVARDLRSIAADAVAAALNRESKEKTESTKVNLFDWGSRAPNWLEETLKGLTMEDFEVAMEKAKKRTMSSIGAPKVPNVKWEDVGGLEDVKQAILDTVQLPLQHRELFSSGLKQRSGVLLYGPPGTGKTLLAKAVATECSLNFLSVKGPELMNSYIGESEKNVREVFRRARAAQPCVIFFDELDALAPARGVAGDSGGVMDRVVSQLLAEVDGLSSQSQSTFVIGASNRPDLIDPALLRPGRFDKLLYVGLSDSPQYRQRVLSALTRKFLLGGDVDLWEVARHCSGTFTGADLYAVCADAWMLAAKRKVAELEKAKEGELGDVEGGQGGGDEVEVQQADFIQAAADLTPSLSAEELMRYERLRNELEGGR